MNHYYTHSMMKNVMSPLAAHALLSRLLIMLFVLLTPVMATAQTPAPEKPSWSWTNPFGETGTGHPSKAAAVAAMKASCSVCRDLVNERLSAVSENSITFKYFSESKDPVQTDTWVYPRMEFFLLDFSADLSTVFATAQEQEDAAEAEFFDPIESTQCGDNFIDPASAWFDASSDSLLNDIPAQFFDHLFDIPADAQLVGGRWQGQLKQGFLKWEASPDISCLGGPGEFFGDYRFSRLAGLYCIEPYTDILDNKCVLPQTATVTGPLDVECESVANPCSPATGSKLESAVDITTGELVFTRHYNSLNGLSNAGFGTNWTHNYHKRIVGGFSNDENASMISGDGQQMRFVFSQEQTDALNQDVPVYVGQSFPGYGLVVERSLNEPVEGVISGYVLRLPDGNEEHYDRFGRLEEMRRNGAVTTLSYDEDELLQTIQSDVGHQLLFAYDTEQRITQITTGAGDRYQYAYDDNDNLQSVTYPPALGQGFTPQREYLYEDTRFPNHLTGIIDENGQRFGIYAYDDQSRVLSSEHAQTSNSNPQHRYTFEYGNDQTVVTDPGGTQVLWEFERQLNGFNQVVSKQYLDDQKNRGQLFDDNNNLIEHTDQEGLVRRYEYNDNEQMILQTIAPAGGQSTTLGGVQTREIRYQYLPPATQLVTRIDEPSVRNSLRKITEIDYDDNFNVSEVKVEGFTVDGATVSRRITMQYNNRGRITRFDGPRTDVNDVYTFEYNNCSHGSACGQLSRVNNPLGHTTIYNSYDGNGRLTRMTDPVGVVSTLSYHPRGWLERITQTPVVGEERITRFAYDGLGQLTEMFLPDGIELELRYDAAHELRSVTDNLGNRIEYRYDTRGNRQEHRVLDAEGELARNIQLQYNLRNHIEQINDDGSIYNMVQNARGDLVGYTDANANPDTQQDYDVLGRVTRTVDALANPITYEYDIADQLIEVRATNGSVTQFAYDDLGNQISENSGDRGALSYIHDAAGNMTSMTDARGITVDYQYDALNRLTAVLYPDSAENVTYTYDDCSALAVGRLCAVQHEAGAQSYDYDAWGNVVSVERLESGLSINSVLTTQYVYDAGNRIVQMTYPSGREVNYQRDAIGRIVAIDSTSADGETQTVLSERSYRADDLWLSQVFGSAGQPLSQTRQYDLQGRLQSLSAATSGNGGNNSVFGVQYTYDANGNPLSTTGSLFNQYEYDELDRLRSHDANNTTGGAGSSQSLFTYDANGNRISLSLIHI